MGTNKFMRNTILVTGGAGFIGSNFLLSWMKHTGLRSGKS